MTGAEHYVEAERLLADSDELLDGDLADAMVRRAGVHAELAHAAASVIATLNSPDEFRAWREAVSAS